MGMQWTFVLAIFAAMCQAVQALHVNLRMEQSQDGDGPENGITLPDDLPDEVSADVVQNLKAFVESSGGKRAVLVTIGDSTMGGVETRLWQALHTERADLGLYNFGQCPGWGAPCKSFKEAPAFNEGLKKFEDVHSNIKEALSILEESNCTLGGHGFLVRSYMHGSLIHYSWGFGAESFGACWAPCLTNAIKALQPNAVLVNQGLHLLHAYPYRSCAKEENGPVSYFDCGTHEDLVTTVMQGVASVSPIAIWKTSNWVCDEKYYGHWREAIDNWHDPVKKLSLEKSCREECPAFTASRPCGDEVIDARSTKLQHEQALSAVEAVKATDRTKRIGTVDAYAVSENRCDATEDGRHYRDLDPDVVQLLAAELARLAMK